MFENFWTDIIQTMKCLALESFNFSCQAEHTKNKFYITCDFKTEGQRRRQGQPEAIDFTRSAEFAYSRRLALWSFIEFGAIGREGYSLIEVYIDLSPILFALFRFI